MFLSVGLCGLVGDVVGVFCGSLLSVDLMPWGFGGVVLVLVGRRWRRWEEVCAVLCGAEHCGELLMLRYVDRNAITTISSWSFEGLGSLRVLCAQRWCGENGSVCDGLVCVCVCGDAILEFPSSVLFFSLYLFVCVFICLCLFVVVCVCICVC